MLNRHKYAEVSRIYVLKALLHDRSLERGNVAHLEILGVRLEILFQKAENPLENLDVEAMQSDWPHFRAQCVVVCWGNREISSSALISSCSYSCVCRRTVAIPRIGLRVRVT